MDDKEIAKRFGAMGGKARGKKLTAEQKRESGRKAAILKWYPSEEVFKRLQTDPRAKAAYLKEMRKLRKNKKPL